MTGRQVVGRLAAVLLSATLLTSCTSAGLPEASPSTSTPADVVDKQISRQLRKTLPSGASGSLVAARADELIHCAGFGMADREAGIRADCDTAYDVMSMTKQFTAAAILKLEMLGELHVQQRIGAFFADVPKDKTAITVHQLLTHTSGLVESLGGDYGPLTRDDFVSEALATPLAARPGAAYRYSNVGYSLLAAIIEKVSGMGYEEFLAEQLFSPAGMTSTGYVLPHWAPHQVAVEYDARGRSRGTPLDHPWGADGPYWNLLGNGGILSTARDMFRWHVALDGDQVLDAQAKRQLFRPYVREEPGGDTFYGYGWVIVDTGFGTIAVHDGGNSWSYGEVLELLDQDAFVFWVTNQVKSDRAGYDLEGPGASPALGVVQRLLDR